MNFAKKAAVRTKDFVVKHKTALAVVTTASVLIVINRIAIRDFQEYLEQTDQTEAFLQWGADPA